MELLQKVTCSGIIERRYLPPNKRTDPFIVNKKWIRSESIFIGYIIGERTLSDGWSEYQGDGEGNLYTPELYFKAYIVVYDIHRKPVYVLPGDIKIIQTP